jgi:hypothetical protein
VGTKATYQSQQVTVVRPARQGDPGYDAKAGEQVLIKLADATEKAVPKAEVVEAS